MRRIANIIIFSFRNFTRKDFRVTNDFHSTFKIWTGIVFFLLAILLPATVFAQAAASSNYATQTGTLGSTYSWIDCSSGSNIVTGDDERGSISWPFTFSFYDNTYTTSKNLSVATNGFIRLDGTANTSWQTAGSYNLSSGSTELGQIVAMAMYDAKVGDNGGWVRSLVTGSAPNRIFTIEYNNIEIDYNDGRYANVQVSFYETSNKVVLKLGTDNITKSGVDMGLHSGVSGYFDKWQEVESGTNNTWIEYTRTTPPVPPSGPAASWNYGVQTGTIGSTYSWINCASGSTISAGDDSQTSVNWPFNFNFYDNNYTTTNYLSVASNGFIRLDAVANGGDYSGASNYDLTSNATGFGQIIAMAMYDGSMTGNSSWIRSLVTGTAPERIFTIEYNNLEIDYNDGRYADVQVSFYESSNKIVLKLGTENLKNNLGSVDMGLHSGVNSYFHKWQNVNGGTQNTWIEYSPPNIEVNATTGTSLAYYPTLKDAFDKINDGTHQGVLTVKINSSTTESSSAVLNASGNGSANYNSLHIYPTVSGLSINGDLYSPLIDLNGADKVIIDGRVNATGTGKDLSIINTSTGSAVGTSAIRFINSASNNTIKYCTIKSSESRSTSGILFFSTTTATASSGNNNNIIENNNITNATDANRPVNAIYSSGTNGKDNSGNIIRNNNIYNFIKHASASRGILLEDNNTAWAIDGNSFYETTSFSPTGTVTYDVIKIDNISGNGFTVSNNYFGGSAAQCGGTAWTKNNTTNNVFNAINLNVGTTVASSVQNNTIRNFNWSNSANATWTGISISAGSVNIGTESGNTIGATTGTGSIRVAGGTNGQSIYGIKILSAGEVNCYNNSIGSITGATSSTFSTHIYGIDLSGSANANIENNTIGSTTTSNSIYASSASTSNVQKVYGIYTESSGTTLVHNNTISNLRNNTSNTAVGTGGLINGIYSAAGTNTISDNTISDISIGNANTSTFTPSIAGIYLNTTTNAQSIQNNLIYNISNTYTSFTGRVVGVFARNSTGASPGNISENFIHSLSVGASTGASIYGIYGDTDGITYSNNIVSLGGSTSTEICGIFDNGETGKAVNIYFNSICISGTNSGAGNSYAVRFRTGNNSRDLRNNILYNARSGGSGGHYAIYYNTAGGTFTADYNDYFVSGTGGVIAHYNGDQSTLALLKTATGQDANSLAINPNFKVAGSTVFSDYYTASTLPGFGGTGILLDYEGITRNNPPKMGALESSLGFVWQGNTSSDFATATNWLNGVVPPNGANISFAATPANDCVLSGNHTLKTITNTSAKKLVLNGKELRITGSIASATVEQIDATSASSVIIFAGTVAQNLVAGVFVGNTINSLTLNNPFGLTQSGNITVSTALSISSGAYKIGTNTLTINGTTAVTSGTLVGGSTSNIIFGGSGASTSLPSVSLNNLTLNRTNGISLSGNVSVGGLLSLATGTLNVGSNSLTISGDNITRTNGDINSDDSNGFVIFSNAVGIELPISVFTGSTIQNLTINGAGGLTVNENITLNGVLNLANANPKSNQGLLDMTDPFELIMGADATNEGGGDVTGIITRTTLLDNHTYTFGNKNTWLSFYSGSTSLPDYMKLKVVIGSDPWGTGAIARVYELIRANGNNYLATFRAFYLDTELNGNAENELSFWAATFPFTAPVDNARSNFNTTENWVEISDFDLDYLPSTFGELQISMDESTLTYQTWSGIESDDWNNPANWAEANSSGTVPTPASFVVIPDASTTNNDPTLPAGVTTELKTISLKAGSILNAGNNAQLSLNHNIGTWNNAGGTFNPGNSTVNFIFNGNTTISGTTTFNNIFISEFTAVNMTASSYIKVAGGITINEVGINSGEFRTKESGETTVEYNGANQTITNPINSGGNSGYHKLILSGSGIKTMPATAMNIADELTLTGNVTATAQAPLSVDGEMHIKSGAAFTTGAFNHNIGSSFDVEGTFSASAGSTITLNGNTPQSILGSAPVIFEKLNINNAANVNIFNAITVNDELTLTNGNLNVGTTTLTINGGLVKTAGFINVNALSSLTFGGTTALTLPATLFATTPTINNLTVTRTGGVTAGSDLTINGILNLQSSNPSATIGSFDTGNNTLFMGAAATTIGNGDVTGIVRRDHTFNTNTEYTFGSQFTTFTFTDGNLKPTWISLKISIGSVPAWSPWTPSPNGKIKRLYQVASSDNSSSSQATINMRYLLSELDATHNDASKLVFWHKFVSIASGVPHEHGKANQDFTNNTIGVTGLPLGFVTTANLDDSQVAIAYAINEKNTWKGGFTGQEEEWGQAQNWTAGHVPLSTDDVLIPGGLTYYPSLTASANAVAKTLEIATGASVAANSYNITIYGFGGAWINQGTFLPGTGKVLFNHGVPSETVTISGITNFYNIEVGPNTTFQPVPGNILRIAGVGSADPGGTSVIDFSSINNTVEWNGTVDQTIVDPNGIGGNGGYFNLILSGSGTKTMQNSVINIAGDFSTSGSITAIASNSIKVNDNMTIGAGSSFVAGNFSHELAGDFENNGTFTVSSGGTFTFSGEEAQTVSGTSTTSFNNLTIDKTINNVSISSNVDVNNVLLLSGGNLIVGNTTLGINGTISNPSGAVEVGAVSNLNFGGTFAITLNNNLFNGNPTINNLTVNRLGGVALGNESITIDGTLALTAGTLTIGANTLTISGSSPIRTSGNINAGNASATLAFTNSAPVILPGSIFSGNVNNLTINGTGGITAGSDISVNNVLNLQSANPTDAKGSLDMGNFTINMGATATTVGTGDVTGIVRREHAFTNGVEYSFGNRYTNLNFLGVTGSTKPTWVSCKIEIGTAPTWRNEAIKRYYSFAQSGGNDRMIVKLHYLDSELHGTETDETQLVFWDAYDPALGINNFVQKFPRNHNATDATNNWIQLTGPAINYLATSSTLDVKQWGLGYTNVSIHKWIGLGSVSYPGDWSLPGHWDGGVPQSHDDVLIPAVLPGGNSGYPYRNLLPVISPAVAQSVEIEAGAILTSNGYDITVSGFGNAWINNGTFIPGNGTVIFNHGNEEEFVNLSGTSNFNNLTVSSKTYLQAASGSITRIGGVFDVEIDSKLDFTSNVNTVEYNGSTAQNIANQATETTAGYYHLIFSGGTKTLSSDELKIYGNLTTNAAVSASGNTLTINGTAAQSITGTVTPTLNNLSISNTTNPVSSSVNLTCSGNFTNSGDFDMTSAALAVAGTVTNSGTVKTSSVSSNPLPSGKTWGGLVQYYNSSGNQTAVGGTFNNLTFSNTSGTQTAAGNLTINGTLTTTAGGLLNMASYQLLGTLSTISNGGIIQTQNISAVPIPTGKTWGGTVQYNNLSGGQTVIAGTYNALTISNTSGTQATSGNITATTLNTAAGGTINMGTNALSATNLSHSGILRTQNTSSTPFTSGLTWGGTVVFDGTAGQTLPASASVFNNLSISNPAGVTAAANQTVNGILNLSVANPDATHGSLDMSTFTLNLGASSTTTGIGDVTGIITRTSFAVNTIYTYGNKNQYVLFPVVSGQTLPSELSVRVTLLSTPPSWVTNGTRRLYELTQTGGVGTKASFRANYLDSELASGVDESLLSIWSRAYQSLIVDEGWADYNSAENWLTITDVDFQYLPIGIGNYEITLAPTSQDFRTWNGSQSPDWNTASNWSPNGKPTPSLGIVIPNVSSSNNVSPNLPVDAEGKYIIIQNGGIVNTVTNAALTLSGNGNVWSMETGGVFNPGNSVVTLDGNVSAGIVEISGSTDFYDFTISSNTTLRAGTNSYMGILGTLTINGIFAAATNHNVIEFKQNASLTLPNPNGSTPGYHTLIVSGTGTKTLPPSLDIWHDFINNGTVDAGTGLVKINGNYSLQTIGGTSTTDFYDLEIDNTIGTITTTVNITASNSLTVNAGAILKPGATNTIGGTGTLTGSGTVIVTGLGGINSFCTQYPITTKTLTNLTVDYNGAGDQTVCAADYGDLLISPNGTRTVTLASSGTIGVSGVFDPDLTLTDYIVTGSTMNSNGTGSQTVPAFNYYNVLVSGARNPGSVVTLVNGGTIGIAGHSTVVPDVNTSYIITNNTIDINGSGDQNIDPFTFWNVIFSGGGTKTTSGDLTVVGSFKVEPGVTLDMSSSVLAGTFNGGIINNGTIKTANTSAAPLPTGIIWDGIINYNGSSAQTVVQGTYNNLEMSGAGGGTAAADITVNGVLNLNHVNPSPTQGILHTGAYTLNMGESATTTGPGDVTGIVKREHTFSNGTEYSFGNQFTTFNFLGISGSTKPTWLSCKIEIGAAPSWRSVAVKRFYSFAQSGGDDRVITKLHYLDSELNTGETDESKLIFWGAYPGPTYENSVPRGKSGFNETNNWLTLSGMAINMLATGTLDFRQWGLSYTNVDKIIWTGTGTSTYSGDWSLPGNWIGGVPSATDDVLIPGTLPVGSAGYPYRNLLSDIWPSTIKTLEIEAGATVTATDYDITVSGDANAWVNNGTFIPGTGTVIFNNGNTSNAATIAGVTNFYNIMVSDNTKIQATPNNILRIGGLLSIGTGSILDFSSTGNTVDYSGNDIQSIFNPNGDIPGYYHLTLSSIGTITLPATLNVLGDFTIDSPVKTSGNTTVMSGTALQTISGSNTTTFNNLTIDNATGVSLNMDYLTTVEGTLQIDAGRKLEVAAGKQLTVSGTITNNGGAAGLVLNSDASGTASLMHEDDNVPATMQRYIGGDVENWHFLSSPVSNQSIAGDWLPAGTYGNGTGYDLYVWDEPTPCWVYHLNTTVAPTWPGVHPTTSFVPGRGYLYSVQALNPTKEFAGNLNNDNVSYGLTADGSADLNLQGFNLVGNPYPSSIDWRASNGWTRDNLVTSGGGNDMWIWNPVAGNYGVYNSADESGVGTNAVTRYIPSMQGFFVRAESAGNLQTTNDVRVHDATTLWKSGQIETNRFIAVVYSETDQTFDEVRLLFGYPENKAGAAKLFSPAVTAPSLYLPEGKANFTIRYLTDTIANPHIPLMFKAGIDGYYTIRFDFDTYDFDIAILEDRLTGGFTDLTLEPDYNFRASTKDNENRFIIHFGAIPAKANMELPANIYASGGELVIDLTLVDEPTDVQVVDVLGRTILQKNVGGNTIHRLPLNAISQVFIVFARSKNAQVSKKVFVH